MIHLYENIAYDTIIELFVININFVALRFHQSKHLIFPEEKKSVLPISDSKKLC